jgi:4-hydroxy-tetrahydrodipicolinate reductase
MGRMGSEVLKAVLDDPELELSGAVDPMASGLGGGILVAETEVGVLERVEDLDAGSIDVLVDFTRASAAVSNIIWALDNGIHCVVGTTGIPDEELARIRSRAESGEANVIIAANFALGAVLMMRFSEMAARVFDQCEIIELHHRGKRDAPSGTALSTAGRVDKAMGAPKTPPPSETREVEGTRGGSVGAVQIHSVRLDGLVAHQEVLFGSRGETLSIRHDTTDRGSFMPGVLLAVKAVGETPGLTTGIESLLEAE